MGADKTIAAISTPLGTGGVGMIRLSGEKAREIGDRIFRGTGGKTLAAAPGYTALYGKVYTGEQVLDEAVALVFAAPHSYTGEDVVELSVHGGLYVVRELLRSAVSAGAALAGPGEFTRRAFLNGKLDLAQAESVMNIISATGEQSLRAASAVREGAVSERTDTLASRLMDAAAELAAFSDYPEEEIPQLEPEAFSACLREVKSGLASLLSTYDAGRILREGVDTVIAGRPNVGKSTLMNLLAGCQRSIVTPVAGTTRDVVEETVMLGDIRLNLADTAGLRQTEDLVEQIGVQRSRERMGRAGLILAVFDASQPADAEDLALIGFCKNRPAVAVVNKTDLPVLFDASPLRESGIPVVFLSAQQNSGLSELVSAVERLTGAASLDPSAVILVNERQRECVAKALEAVGDAVNALEAGYTLDAVGVCLDDALAELLKLTGRRVTDAVADEVFRRFCVGK